MRRRSAQLYKQIQGRIRRSASCTGPYFATVSGRPNRILERNRRGLRVRASRPAFNASPERAEAFWLRWDEIKVAVELLVIEGLVDRKGLEAASRYSSAVMGILIAFLPGKVCKVRLRTGRFLVRAVEVRVFIGGVDRDLQAIRMVDQAGGACVLMSFYHLRQRRRGRAGAAPAWLRHIRERDMVLLLDSGGFSFWQGVSGSDVDYRAVLDDFCAFVQEFGIRRYLALDVVGDWEATRQLLLDMLRRGLHPMPIYHYGAPWAYLDWLTRQGFPVIALGGHVGLAEEERRRWLREVFDRYGHCQLFHGLGIGSLLAVVHPFFSVDSTTYLVGRPRSSRSGTRGCRVQTDLGQRPAAVTWREAVACNLRYSLGLTGRSGHGAVQVTLAEFLDGLVAS